MLIFNTQNIKINKVLKLIHTPSIHSKGAELRISTGFAMLFHSCFMVSLTVTNKYSF